MIDIFDKLSESQLKELKRLVRKNDIINKESLKLVFANMVDYLVEIEKMFKSYLPDICIDWRTFKYIGAFRNTENTIDFSFTLKLFERSLDKKDYIPKDLKDPKTSKLIYDTLNNLTTIHNEKYSSIKVNWIHWATNRYNTNSTSVSLDVYTTKYKD